MKHKKLIIGIIVAIVAVIVIAIGLLCFLLPSVKPFKATSDKPVSFVISTNETFDGVLNDLEKQGVLEDSGLVKLYTSFSKPSLMPGQYTINSKVNIKQFINILNEQKTVTMVIPEGYTINQIADIFGKIGICTPAQFIDAVNAYPLPEFIKPVDGRKYQLEGYLFPSTYHFKKGITAKDAIGQMLSSYVLVLQEAMKTTGVKITPAQINEITTKASIIQKEAGTLPTMKEVSSVLNNRLAKNMPLQMDATVLYAMDKLGQPVNKVYYKDLKTESPYNTYLNKGLPIGPICNPGKKAIEAALQPDVTNNLYYILTPKVSFFTPDYNAFLAKKAEVIGN